MGKSTNQPDATDVAMMMGAMESLHDCRVECRVTTAGQGQNGIMTILLVAKFVVVGALNNQVEIATKSQYPCTECRSLDTHIFRGLYSLDFAIGAAYAQEKLPGA